MTQTILLTEATPSLETDKSTSEAIWQILFEKQNALAAESASTEFIKGLKKIGFTANSIPSIEEINSRLSPITGWQIVFVEGFIPAKEFFSFIANKQFPVTHWLRDASQMNYIEEPDFFHDAFGHIPSLTNISFCGFMERIGKLALLCDTKGLEMISRLWWFTFEFGLIAEDGVKIFGGGILSSKEETEKVFSSSNTFIPFSVDVILATSFEIDHIQNIFFVIESFQQLENCLIEVEQKVLG